MCQDIKERNEGRGLSRGREDVRSRCRGYFEELGRVGKGRRRK